MMRINRVDGCYLCIMMLIILHLFNVMLITIILIIIIFLIDLRASVVTALMKLVAQNGSCPVMVSNVINDLCLSASLDVQQR